MSGNNDSEDGFIKLL